MINRGDSFQSHCTNQEDISRSLTSRCVVEGMSGSIFRQMGVGNGIAHHRQKYLCPTCENNPSISQSRHKDGLKWAGCEFRRAAPLCLVCLPPKPRWHWIRCAGRSSRSDQQVRGTKNKCLGNFPKLMSQGSMILWSYRGLACAPGLNDNVICDAAGKPMSKPAKKLS